MTKPELREKLSAGERLGDLFPLSLVLECEIFKADDFSLGNEIIYIPDLPNHDLSFYKPAADQEEVDDILSLCFTGNDFLEECGGDPEKAEAVFWCCYWQCPSTLADENSREEAELEEDAELDSAVEALFDQVHTSMAEHYAKWAALSPMELVERSREITAMRDTFSQLLDAPDLDSDQIRLLLGDDSAIEALAERRCQQLEDQSDFTFALDAVLKALSPQREDALAERPVDQAAGKPSIREQLAARPAQEDRPAAPPRQQEKGAR